MSAPGEGFPIETGCGTKKKIILGNYVLLQNKIYVKKIKDFLVERDKL